MADVTNIIEVRDGQYVPIPNTLRYVLPGPGRLQVTRYTDGRLASKILEGEMKPTKYAIVKNLQRVGWGL